MRQIHNAITRKASHALKVYGLKQILPLALIFEKVISKQPEEYRYADIYHIKPPVSETKQLKYFQGDAVYKWNKNATESSLT